jgi:hypothetical protein
MATPSRIRLDQLAHLSSSSASALTIFLGDAPDSFGQKIETGPAVAKRRPDHGQCLASHGKLA